MARKLLSLGAVAVSLFLFSSQGVGAESMPSSARASASVKYSQLWTNASGSCITAEDTEKLLALLKQAKAAGCTHIVLSEGGCGRIDEQKPEYFENVKKVLEFARQNDLTLAMGTISIGYSGTYFHYDVNLAAGNPVKEVPYIVKGKTAKPDPASVPAIKNIDMQQVANGKLVGWRLEQPDGKETKLVDAVDSVLDKDVTHEGHASLKGPNVLQQTVACKPFQYYRATWYVKGPKADDDEKYFLRVFSSAGKRRNTYTEPTEHEADKNGWHRYEVAFNTYEATELKVGFGGGEADKNWFADLKIEPAGMLLLVQRERIPLVVTNSDGKTVYEQGKDFGVQHLCASVPIHVVRRSFRPPRRARSAPECRRTG
jgi:hypothetical protein